ncbi:MAG TPA: MFS transporter [Acidobacteriaceae bacterium]|jgi:PAT family beta-lactamase induction signal transducer AmpG|nr:MFS transporter [Acidobacteriaceae bacterium]
MEHAPPLIFHTRARLLAMGFAMAPLGFVFGFINTGVPILLAAQGVSVGRIASVVVICYLPTSIGFLGCPILDVRFTRRAYIIVCALIAALSLAAAVLLYRHIDLFTAFTVLSCTAVVFLGNALGGWQADVIPSADFGWLGAWLNIANLGAAGIFGTLTIHLVRTLPIGVAAALLALIILLPLLLLFAYPAPLLPTRGAGETFRRLFRDIFHIFRQRACLLGLLAFLLPSSCFALSDVFASLGKDFHTSENAMANLDGVGVAIACSLGTLIGAVLCNKFFRGKVYVAIGFGGAICSIALMFTPHTLLYFAGGLLGYSFVQGINYTAFSAFSLDLTGPNNPLAATQIAVLTAAANMPILYMAYLEGHVHDRFGLRPMFAVDAGASVLAATLLLYLFRRYHIDQGPLTQPEIVIAAS